MAQKRSTFIEALNRSEARKDGGFKQNWSFSHCDGSEEKKTDSSLVTMSEAGEQRDPTPEGKKSPPLKPFCTSDSLKTYERRPNQLRMYKGSGGGLNRLGVGKAISETQPAVTSPGPNRANYFILSPAPSPGVLVQGRLFQHANAPAVIRKASQSNHDLKERKDFTTQPIQRVDIDSIILTCPEVPAASSLVLGGDIKRRIQSKRSTPLEASGSFVSPAKKVEALDPQDYFTVCGKCSKQSENHVKCQNCGNALVPDSPARAEPASPLARPPARPQAAVGPNNLLAKSFYGPASVRSQRVDVVMSPPVRITRGSLVLPRNGRAVGYSPYAAKGPKGSKRQPAAKQNELNDPIVLSSDDDEEEEEDMDNGSTGSVSRMDSISPRPADSAHSSPAPSGGRVEAAVKGRSEQEEITDTYITDSISKLPAPRKHRMKDQFGNMVPDETNHSPTLTKRRKVSLSYRLDSIILDCRSVRVGTLRRMVTKPVIFTVEYIQIETAAPDQDGPEKVKLRASELTSCEWCSTRKLPSIFLQTTPAEGQRLRSQLKMSQDEGGVWYDCNSTSTEEKYIVLIFETGLSMHEQVILEDILQEISRANNLSDFPAKLTFEEANVRLVQYNRLKGKTSDSAIQRRMSTRLRDFFDEDEDEDDMAELHPTFAGPVVKLIVYPPPPAKGGISVTNEDLHCLNNGEFLNDVIIDFYLKYLFMEKLKKEDAHRSHVFSSFFYKRLNQRERRNVPDTANLPIQKRKHNRVKTWTRHVDLFQKDFIFVPINESAHWYLAVICFPGLEGARFEPGPLPQAPPQAPADGSAGEEPAAQGEEQQQASANEEPEGRSETTPTPGSADASSESDSNSEQARGGASSNDGAPEGKDAPGDGQNGQADAQPHYTDGLHRISVCYGSKDGAEDTCTFSDDQSSSQDECSEDGAMSDDTINYAENAEWTSRPTVCKQPCILIMDSLRGPTRSTVVKTLREYLEVEWEVRKGTQRSFGKEVMRGSSPRVPQQDNFSDCGVYILQYVESFFESPLPSFHLPMNLTDWFPQQRMKKKREEIKDLILAIQSQQQMDKKGPTQGQGSAPPTDPKEGSAPGPDAQDTAVSS
ncbi:sentrin-specific protease 6 isoform X2 [Conger conger]|uniref:sentrin-specific protease 6 isoform X2 n=1 Tax=Conger conger TaxID=82655 RepID=UPI002A5B0D28|nr:sentrin-specific protease 6 isoform X2 [Conger conger]